MEQLIEAFRGKQETSGSRPIAAAPLAGVWSCAGSSSSLPYLNGAPWAGKSAGAAGRKLGPCMNLLRPGGLSLVLTAIGVEAKLEVVGNQAGQRVLPEGGWLWSRPGEKKKKIKYQPAPGKLFRLELQSAEHSDRVSRHGTVLDQGAAGVWPGNAVQPP